MGDPEGEHSCRETIQVFVLDNPEMSERKKVWNSG